MVSVLLKKYTLITLCRKVLEVSEVSPVIDENVRNVTTILKTEENLRIMCEETMTENGFLHVLQALNSLNILQALQVY